MEPYQLFVDRKLSSRTLTIRHEEPRDKAIYCQLYRHHETSLTSHRTKAEYLKQAQHRKFRGHPPRQRMFRVILNSLLKLVHRFIHSKPKDPHDLEINILSAMGIQRYKTSTSQIIKCIQQLTPPHIYLAKPEVKIESC